MLSGTLARIDRYEIKSLIGAGGMGSLYLARDTNPNTSRLVALKLLNAQLDSADLRERFARESRALAALSHPNIVSIYDSGEFHGSPYIVMEFVRGETLAEKIKRRAPLSISQKLTMMIELCAGLAHAHEAGIIHRDIKPANLMVDLRGCLKILDFGIARVAEGSMTRAAVQVTQFNMRIGTPGYMSPEQIEGTDIDRRSDTFAVGTVFYELLTYTAAFTGSTTRQIENKVLQSEPTPLRSLVADLAPEIAAIVGRALEKDPDKRYQDAESLQRALEHERWRLGPAISTPPALQATPPPMPGRMSRDTRADAVYHRSMSVYQEGAVEAARRFALEALAEDPLHPGARELLEKLDPRPWLSTPFPVAPPGSSAPRTVVATTVDDAGATVVRTHVEQARAASTPSRARYAELLKRYRWPAAIAGGALLFVALAVVLIRWAIGPSGHTLTVLKPTGGSLLSNGISCGTIGSSCTTTREDGEAVEVQAQPDEGFLFGGYTGDCAPAGRMLMNGPQTCGATFNAVPPAPPPVLRLLTITRPRNGTIVTDVGITCGTRGSDCSVEVADGRRVNLEVLADEGFRFVRFTGACEPDGQAIMTQPQTCSAVFNPNRIAQAPPQGPPPTSLPVRPPAKPDGGVSTPQVNLPAPGGSSASASGGSGGNTGTSIGPLGPGMGPAPPPVPPEETARAAIRRTLDAYCTAYANRDADAIKRVFPGARVSQEQFRQLKSVECSLTGDPKFGRLDPVAGTATVEVGMKQVVDQTVGGTQTRETIASLTMMRPEPRGEWFIQTLNAREKR
jgi:hypothetical protein